MKAYVLSARDTQVVPHCGFLLTGFCRELHATICCAFDINKDVAGTDTVKDGALRKVFGINDGRGMTDGRAHLGLVIGVVVVTATDASKAKAMAQLVLPEGNAGARAIERSAID